MNYLYISFLYNYTYYTDTFKNTSNVSAQFKKDNSASTISKRPRIDQEQYITSNISSLSETVEIHPTDANRKLSSDSITYPTNSPSFVSHSIATQPPTPQQTSTSVYRKHTVSDSHEIELHTKKPKIDQESISNFSLTSMELCLQQIAPNASSLFSTLNVPPTKANTNPSSELITYSGNSPITTIAQPTPQQPSTGMYRMHTFSDPHEIRIYRNYLKARYQRTEFPTYFKEPSPSIRNFINLELVRKTRENKEERVEGMTKKLHGNVARYLQERRPLSIEQIAEVREGEKLPRNILIEGDPGVGKTTLVWELCKGWGEGRLLRQWDVVVLVQLRDKYMREADTLREILDPHEQFGSDLHYHLKNTNGKGVMIIYDSYDELSCRQREHKSVFQRLLTGGVLPEATIIVTSRPSATRMLSNEFKKNLHEHIEVVGFSDDDIDEYIKCKFTDDLDLLGDFQSYISSHPFIYKAMYIPLHCALVTDLYQTYWGKGKKEFAPQTITQLYTCFIHSLLERYLDDHPVYGPQELSVQELTDLPHDVYDNLMKLAELAANGIEEQQYVFDNITHNTLGLMQRVDEGEFCKSKSVSYSFLHLTLQEYLAALYWSKLSPENVSRVFSESGALPMKSYAKRTQFWIEEEHARYEDEVDDQCDNDDNKYSNIHWPALHFYAGLTNIVGTPLETIVIGMEASSINHNILYLLFESQNPEYISSVLKENQFHVYMSSKLQGYITGYCIVHSSSSSKWSILASDKGSLQSMINIVSCNNVGGTIISLEVDEISDYIEYFRILFECEHYAREIFSLSLKLRSFESNIYGVHCDQLSQLYRYYPKLQIFRMNCVDLRLNCNPLFSSLHLMTLETLELTGVVIDDLVSKGLKQATTLKSLILKSCDLMNLSAEELSQNRSLVSLDLSNISMNVEGYRGLRQLLKENENITTLSLSDQKSLATLEVIKTSMGESLETSLPSDTDEHTVTHTELFTLLQNSQLVREIFEGIQQSKVETLSLCDINECDVELLRSLQKCHLSSLTLFRVPLDSKTLEEVLRKNFMLTSLALGYLDIDEEEAMTLKDILLENTTLRELMLFDCISSTDAAELIAQGLKDNTGIRKLKLMYGDVVRTLIQHLSFNKSLQSLILLGKTTDTEDLLVVSELLKQHPVLKYLTIADDIDPEKAKYLADSLVSCKLEEIVISDFPFSSEYYEDPLGNDGAKLLADAVMNNPSDHIKLILPITYQDYLSVYSYPADRVMYKSEEECT